VSLKLQLLLSLSQREQLFSTLDVLMPFVYEACKSSNKRLGVFIGLSEVSVKSFCFINYLMGSFQIKWPERWNSVYA
jgi:hypothetical protein